MRLDARTALKSTYFLAKPDPTPEDQLPQPKINRTVAGLLHQHEHQRVMLNPLDPGLAGQLKPESDVSTPTQRPTNQGRSVGNLDDQIQPSFTKRLKF